MFKFIFLNDTIDVNNNKRKNNFNIIDDEYKTNDEKIRLIN